MTTGAFETKNQMKARRNLKAGRGLSSSPAGSTKGQESARRGPGERSGLSSDEGADSTCPLPNAMKGIEGCDKADVDLGECEAAKKAFSWYIDSHEPKEMKIQLEFDRPGSVSQSVAG